MVLGNPSIFSEMDADRRRTLAASAAKFKFTGNTGYGQWGRGGWWLTANRRAEQTAALRIFVAGFVFAENRGCVKGILWVVVLLCVPRVFAQNAWVMPKLREIPWTQTIGSGKVRLSASETTLLKRASDEIIAACVKYPGPGDPTTARGFFESLRVERIEIAPDSEKALLAQGNDVCMCGAVGNCPLWLISGDTRPHVLLAVDGIHWFEINKHRVDQHFNLVLGSHDSAMETFLQRFRFNGVKYVRAGCALIEYDGEGRLLPKPEITPISCK